MANFLSSLLRAFGRQSEETRRVESGEAEALAAANRAGEAPAPPDEWGWLETQNVGATSPAPSAGPRDPQDAFLYYAEWASFPQSSNVRAARYFKDRQEMEVEYGKPGKESSFYGYGEISLEDARALYLAGSKGEWTWDVLRVRGTQFGFRRPYWFISGPSQQRRRWMATEESRRRHGEIGPSGE